ncbi:leader peptidase (prepilin peptidase)/N-methyltransferase [Acetobacter aceti NBRC 14818]|nr:leader peptidase (prepilin peptidase)/N-methyltransferase [Acetobacter aceti NBRC 14818]
MTPRLAGREDSHHRLAQLEAIRHCRAAMMSLAPVVPFVIAPFIGSFLGVLVRRIPRGESFAIGRSHCEDCQTVLKPHEMIPVLSYLLQKGKCRTCGSRIDPHHLRIELTALAVPACVIATRLLTAHEQGFPLAEADFSLPLLLADCFLGWMLLALAWIDRICMRLPDVLTLPLLLAGLAEGFVNGGTEALLDRTLGAVCGWALFALVAYGYRALRGRSGLGGGDVKLLAAGGAWIGLAALPIVVVLASAFGIVIALATTLRAQRFSMTVMIPFGPCLAAAIWLARLTLTAQ